MKPKNPTITLLLLLGLMTLSANALANEIACSSYEGKFNRCPLANANSLNVRLSQELEGECIKGETWGADSDGVWVDDDCAAVFTYESHGSDSGSSGGHCPYDHPGRSNECAYYRDGYKAGKKDLVMPTIHALKNTMPKGIEKAGTKASRQGSVYILHSDRRPIGRRLCKCGPG